LAFFDKRCRKPEEYKALNFFGPNIVTAEGEEWKKHRYFDTCQGLIPFRTICNPAFAESNLLLVHKITGFIVNIPIKLFKLKMCVR
jgi:hypothetical protein